MWLWMKFLEILRLNFLDEKQLAYLFKGVDPFFVFLGSSVLSMKSNSSYIAELCGK